MVFDYIQEKMGVNIVNFMHYQNNYNPILG